MSNGATNVISLDEHRGPGTYAEALLVQSQQKEVASRKVRLHRPRLRPRHDIYQELDRLLPAVLAERKRRGKKLSASDEISRERKVRAISVPLTQGKLNAVRAAFKAGITPSRIARQFGISQSNVRKALAGNRQES